MTLPASQLVLLATGGLGLSGALGLAGALGQHPTGLHVAAAASTPPQLLDGVEAAWSPAATIVWGEPPYNTSFRALWSADGLWIRFDATDPSPWHTYTRRDNPLWEEEVVEIFIDPDGDGRNYAEVEISPGNVVCDLLMFRGDPDKRSDLDWDFPGLQTAVHAWDSDTSGWTAVALLPWAGFATLPGTDMRLPPLAGDSWRFNVFRIKRPHRPDDPHRDLLLSAWSPVPGESFHVPEMFRPMVFK